MTIHRSLRRLEGAIGQAPTEAAPADLERLIDRVVDRGHPSISDHDLERLLVHVAAIHDPGPTPAGLGEHVASCVRCEAVGGEDDGSTRRSADAAARAKRPSRRITGVAAGGGVLATLMSFAGVCLACTVPAVQALLVAVGIIGAGYVLHLVGVAAAPLVVWMVWASTRRHGRQRARLVTVAGGVLMAIHGAFHVGLETAGEVVLSTGPAALLFVLTDWTGTALLVLGAALNLLDLSRWRQAQAAALVTAAVT